MPQTKSKQNSRGRLRASLRGRNAHGQVARANFLCELQGKKAGSQSEHPDLAAAWINAYRKDPSVLTHCLGNHLPVLTIGRQFCNFLCCHGNENMMHCSFRIYFRAESSRSVKIYSSLWDLNCLPKIARAKTIARSRVSGTAAEETHLRPFSAISNRLALAFLSMSSNWLE